MQRNYPLRTAAKLLGTGPNKLIRSLKRLEILDYQRLPRQADIDAGRFVVQLREHYRNANFNGGHGTLYYVTLVTPRGLRWLADQLGVEVIQIDRERAA